MHNGMVSADRTAIEISVVRDWADATEEDKGLVNTSTLRPVGSDPCDQGLQVSSFYVAVSNATMFPVLLQYPTFQKRPQ